VQAKRAVPNKAPPRIALTLRAPGFTNQIVPVQIRRGNRVLVAQEIRLTGGQQRVEMDFTPQEKGFQTYEASIPTQTGEWLTANKRRAFGMGVVDPTIRVFLMEGMQLRQGAPMTEWNNQKDVRSTVQHLIVHVILKL